MEWSILPFDALSADTLYEVMRLRQEVFIVEQHCYYLDADGIDRHALHVLGKVNDRLVAYARIMGPGVVYQEASFGRVLIAQDYRHKGYGRALTQQLLQNIQQRFGDVPVRISAQAYLTSFYGSFGFLAEGEEYLDAGIPHIYMVYRSVSGNPSSV